MRVNISLDFVQTNSNNYLCTTTTLFISSNANFIYWSHIWLIFYILLCMYEPPIFHYLTLNICYSKFSNIIISKFTFLVLPYIRHSFFIFPIFNLAINLLPTLKCIQNYEPNCSLLNLTFKFL